MRKLSIIILLMVLTSGVKAQDLYLTTSLSGNFSVSENMQMVDLFTEVPGLTVSVGNNFSRFFGMRASVGINRQSGRPGSAQRHALPEVFTKYHFLTVSGYVDCMFNLTEMFLEPQIYRTDALYFVVGVGGLSTSGFSDKVNGETWKKYYPVETDGGFYPLLRAGLSGNLKIARNMDLTLEAKYNFISDKYNGVSHGSKVDGFLDLSAGVSWFFSNRHLQRNKIPSLPMEIMDKPTSERYVAGTRMKTGVSFYYGFSELVAKQRIYVQNVADFLKANPSARVVLHGYSDKESAEEEYRSINMSLSQARAESVRQYLIEECNISPDRLSVSAHANPIDGYKQNGEWIRGVEIEMQ